MKKYCLMITFFVSFLLFGFLFNPNKVDAITVDTLDINHDLSNSRNLTIKMNDVFVYTDLIKVYEVELCEAGSDGCEVKNSGPSDNIKTHYLRTLHTTDISSSDYLEEEREGLKSITFTYTIKSPNDGTKYFLIEQYYDEGRFLATGFSTYFEYELSTLNERVILNADRDGNPINVFDGIQYSAKRSVDISMTLTQVENSMYNGIVYVCEVIVDAKEGKEILKSCVEHGSDEPVISYYISSPFDGTKKLNIYLVRNSTILDYSKDLEKQLEDGAEKIVKTIVIDTEGPVINLDGSKWVFVASGKKYQEQRATCSDVVFNEDECSVTSDLNNVTIDYNSDKIQTITYQARDRLGNITYYPVYVRVEIKEAESNVGLGVGIVVGVLSLTGVILGYFLIKGHEKKKKMSYI